jgi:RecB family exonuclease
MTRITYLIGQTVDTRRQLLKEEIATKGVSFKNSLHIVPSRGVIMELTGQGPGWLSRPVDALASITRRIFYDDIFYRSFKGFSYMDDTMRQLALRVILNRRNDMPDGLRYFSTLFGPDVRDKALPGIYHHVLGFFSLLVNNNFEDRFVDQLSRKITMVDDMRPGAGEERYVLDTDLAFLFGDYEEFKRANHFYDSDDITGAVRSFLAAGKSPRLLGDIDSIIFDGFVTITKAEEEILFSLFKNVEEVLWLLDFDPQANDPIAGFKEAVGRERDDRGSQYEAFRIFASLVALMERMEKAGSLTLFRRAPVEEFKNPFASGLYRSRIYDRGKERGVRIRSFNTRLDEIKGIAAEIKRISNLKGIDDLSGIRVIFPDLDHYAPLIYEIFPEFGVPFNVAKGLALVSSPIARLFQLIIDIPLNGYRRDDIRNFLTSSLVSPIEKRMNKEDQLQWLMLLEGHGVFFAEESREDAAAFSESRFGNTEGPQFDIGSLDTVAGQCGIKGGGIVSDWLPRIRDYFSFLYKKLPEETRGTDVLSDYYHSIHQLFHLNANVEPFGDLVSKENPRDIARALFHLLDIFRIPRNIFSLLKDKRGLQQGVIDRIITGDVRVFYTLRDLALKAAMELEKAESYLIYPTGTPLLERFKRVFGILINRTEIRVEHQKGAVDISEWTDIAGRSFDVVFAGGLSAGGFPLLEPDDFIVPESVGGHLGKTDLTDQSRHLLSHILCNCRKDLHLSYPRRILDRDVQPSPVLLDMASMVKDGSTYTGIEELEKAFAWEENTYFTCKEEFLNTVEVEKKTSPPPSRGPFTHERIILGADDFLNESVIRAVRSLMARNSARGLTDYDGLVSSSQNFPHYLSDSDGIFSTSRLDMIANCPQRYLFREIFSLEPVEEVEEELSLKDIGYHVHAILKNVFDALKRRGENVASIGLSRAFALAKEIGEGYFSHLRYLEGLDFFEAQKAEIMDGLETAAAFTETGLPKREGLLAQLLRFEARNLIKEEIVALEYRFGDKTDNPVMVGKTRVRGYIDRVDRLHGKEGISIIYDYKTGRAPTLSEIKKGLSFQLPGYISAISTERDASGVAARYYLVKRRSFSEGNPLTSPVSYNYAQKTGIDLSGINLIGKYADRLMGLLRGGVFHHSTDELSCSYCGFQYACYKNPRRMHYLVDSGAFPDLYSGRKNLEKWREVESLRREWREIQRRMDDPLKRGEARSADFQRVMEFKEWLQRRRLSLPLDENYMDQMIGEIEEYQRRYGGQRDQRCDFSGSKK